MLYIESNQILIDIYKNGMQKISYDFVSALAIKIWNRHFLGRTIYLFEGIGYMEPKDLIPYENTDIDIIEHPLCNIFYMEKDYPYILYSRQVKGWYAWLHLPGVKEFKFKLTDKLADELYMLYDMYCDMVTIRHVSWDKDTYDNETHSDTYWEVQEYLIYGHGLCNTRQSCYYPKHCITLQPYMCNNLEVVSNWKHGNIVSCSYDTLMERISFAVPDTLHDMLDDYCFIAGGYLMSMAIEDMYELGPRLSYGDKQDIDLFIVRGKHDGYEKLNQVINVLKKNGYEIKRKGKTFIADKIHETPIQICPINYSSIMNVIDNFDTSCTAIAYNGSEIFASYNFKKYIRYGATYCKFNSMRKTRVDKYTDRGFMLLFNKEYGIEDDDNYTVIEEPLNLNTCFDDNLFTDKLSNPDKCTIEVGVYDFGSWLKRFERKDVLTIEQEQEARDLCNRLADSYFENDMCTKELYDNIIMGYGPSDIEYYIKDTHYSQYPYYLITGLKNDNAMLLFARLFKYSGL